MKEGLYIHINREIERECPNPACDRGFMKFPTAPQTQDVIFTCPACHGTGLVRRRLVGWVEVLTTGIMHPPTAIQRNPAPSKAVIEVYKQLTRQFVGVTIEDIIAAYLDDALPHDIAAGLKEES